MELKDIQNHLDEMKSALETKTVEEVKNQMAAFEEKYNEAIESSTEEVKKELKEFGESLEAKLNAVQEHADKLDVKMQENKKVAEVETGDAIKSLINENFDEIKNVRKGRSVELKAVGNMTLSTNLTGDQPRDYSMDVAAVPSQLVNVADLIGSVSTGRDTGPISQSTPRCP